MKSQIAMIGAGLLAMVFSACMLGDSSDPSDDGGGSGDEALTLDSAALPTNQTCPSGKVCLFQNEDFNKGTSGCRKVFTPPEQNFNLASLPCGNGSFNDQMTSWKNASSTRYCWWPSAKNGHGSGAPHTMSPHTQQPNVGTAANDRASAIGPC